MNGYNIHDYEDPEILITGSFFVVILTSVFIPYILYIYSMYEMGDIRL